MPGGGTGGTPSSSRRLADALNVAKIGLWEVDHVVDALTWSDEVYRIWERDRADFAPSYEAFLDTVHPEDREAVNDAYLQSLKKKLPYEIRHRLLMPDGRVKHVHERCETIYSAEGKPLRSVGTVQDITERVLAEQAAAERQMLLNGIIQATPSPVFVFSPELKYLYINERGARDLGLSPGEVIGRPIEDFFPEPTVSGIRSDLTEVLRSGKLLRNERPAMVQGELRWYDAFLVPWMGADGEVMRIIGIAHDITERKKSAVSLAESRRLYHDLVETAQDLIWQCDAEGRTTYLNPAWEQIFGYRLEEMIGRRFADFQESSDSQRAIELFERLMRGESIHRYEMVHLAKDGRRLHLSFNAKPVFDEQGRTIGTRGTAIDQTEQRDTEERLAQAERLAALGRMAAGVAHEMNQPLNAIRNSCQGILLNFEEGIDTSRERLERQLGFAIEQVDRMAAIIRELRIFARRSEEPQQEKIRLADVALYPVRLLSHEIAVNDIALSQEVARNPEVTGSVHRLQQVFVNLFINAMDAIASRRKTEPDVKGKIAVRVRRDEALGSAIVEIEDNGIGMKEEDLHRIFEPFFTTKDQERGTGLGLAICHEIVTQHGGTIEALATPGRGAIFFITLPLAK